MNRTDKFTSHQETTSWQAETEPQRAFFIPRETKERNIGGGGKKWFGTGPVLKGGNRFVGPPNRRSLTERRGRKRGRWGRSQKKLRWWLLLRVLMRTGAMKHRRYAAATPHSGLRTLGRRAACFWKTRRTARRGHQAHAGATDRLPNWPQLRKIYRSSEKAARRSTAAVKKTCVHHVIRVEKVVKKGLGKTLHVTWGYLRRCESRELFQNVASLLRSPPKNNARPTRSALQNKPHRQSTPKIWPRLKADVSVIPKARPIQSETSFGERPLATGGYCIRYCAVIG